MIKLKPLTTFAVVALLLGVSVSAEACNVPVFRYALERWRPDHFEVVVFHREPLSDADKDILDEAYAAAENVKAPSNLQITVVDLKSEKLPAWQKKLWSEQKVESQSEAGAWMVIQAPSLGGEPRTFFSGALSKETLQTLIDSPARQELIRRLFAGDSVVWVYLTSEPENQEAEKFVDLKESLAILEKEIELPEGVGEVGSELYARIPLKIHYSILTINRADPAEQMFIRMLLHTTPKLIDSKEVVVCPVFGRGRVLDALFGEDLTSDVYASAATYLSGACSCQVKVQNPGFDLLTKNDWDRMFEGEVPESLVTDVASSRGSGMKTGGAKAEPAKPVLVAIPGSKINATSAAISSVDLKSIREGKETGDGAQKPAALSAGLWMGGLLLFTSLILSLRGLWYRI